MTKNAINKEKYQTLYESMVIKPAWKSAIYRKARQIAANRDKYEEISKECGGSIPWYFIGVIHERESGLNFSKHLHNGDSLTAKTKLVPAGRPLKGKPPFTFLESSVDALKMKGYHEVTDWSIGNQAVLLEVYNGLGYFNKGVPNPYLWSGTQHYSKGKYIKDHVYSASTVDQQMGVIPLLLAVVEVSTENTDYNVVQTKSRRLTFQDRFRKFMQTLGLGTVFSFTFLNDVKSFVTDNAGLLLVGLAGVFYVAWRYMEFRSQEEVKEGRYKPSGSKK
jgi:lysozyme family protein